MLSDHERKTLHEVERRLLADDPEFARAFRAHQTRLRRDPRDAIAVVAAVLLAALMLVAGSVSGAVACVVTIGLIWAVGRHSTGPARPDPPSS